MSTDEAKRNKDRAEKKKEALDQERSREYARLFEARKKLPTASRWSKGGLEDRIHFSNKTIDDLTRQIDEQDRIIDIADADLLAHEERVSDEKARGLAETRTPRVKEALLWWNSEAQDLTGYARIYWEDILKHEKEIVAAYKSPYDQCATMERCREIAKWALKTIPLEVAHHLPNEADRTVDKLAEILRRHHGDKAERLIPLARQILLASLTPPQEPEPQAPAAPPEDSILAGLPPELQTELADLEPGLRNAMSVEEAENLAAQLLAKRDQELKDAGVAEPDRQNRLARYERNLQDAVRKWRRSRGLL